MRATTISLLAVTVTGCNIGTDFDELYEPGSDTANCPNHWTGLDCNVCPGNWDESQDCNACRSQWTGDDCEVCPDNWGGADCDACAGNWDLSESCSICLPGWADVDGDNCGTCVRFVATTGSPAGEATTWGSATNAIQSAIVSAGQAIPATCHVWVQAGTYAPTLGTGDTATFALEDGVELYGGFAVDALAWADRDPKTHVTTLDGGGAPDHVVTAAANTVLDGFTVTGGGAYGTQPGEGEGAGLLVEGVTIGVRNCVFTSNETKLGGAVYVDATGNATFTGCSFDGNLSDGSGGAIWVDGGTVEIADCTFTSNEAFFADSGNGGAIYAGSGSEVSITGSTFTGNRANGGGAISSSSAALTLDICGISGNEAYGYGALGGALRVTGGTLTATRTRFHDNQALNDSRGGAVYASSGAVMAFTNSVFSENDVGSYGVSPRGGAVYAGGASLTLMSCTFWGNVAASNGGDPPEGGAIYLASGSLAGTNTIVWGNTPTGVADSGGVNYTWATFSDLEDGAGPPENNNKNVDPEFAGGTPYDLHLRETSDCINAGTPTGAPADDFDGLPRVGQPDMGAYEYR